jgi:hypothetical protein
MSDPAAGALLLLLNAGGIRDQLPPSFSKDQGLCGWSTVSANARLSPSRRNEVDGME